MKSKSALQDCEIEKLKGKVEESDKVVKELKGKVEGSEKRAVDTDKRVDDAKKILDDLGGKVEEIEKRKDTTGAAVHFGSIYYSRRWRLLMFLGGLVAPGFRLVWALQNSNKGQDRWSYAGLAFWVFSNLCLCGAGIGNPRNISSWKEKLFVGMCGVLMGLPT